MAPGAPAARAWRSSLSKMKRLTLPVLLSAAVAGRVLACRIRATRRPRAPPPQARRGARISAPSRRPRCLPPIAPGRAATRDRRGLAKSQGSAASTGFLREHYTNSRESAAALAALSGQAAGRAGAERSAHAARRPGGSRSAAPASAPAGRSGGGRHPTERGRPSRRSASPRARTRTAEAERTDTRGDPKRRRRTGATPRLARPAPAVEAPADDAAKTAPSRQKSRSKPRAGTPSRARRGVNSRPRRTAAPPAEPAPAAEAAPAPACSAAGAEAVRYLRLATPAAPLRPPPLAARFGSRRRLVGFARRPRLRRRPARRTLRPRPSPPRPRPLPRRLRGGR